VLHYHVLPDRIILFRIAWRRIDAFVIPISRANLDRQLARCLSDLQDDTDTSTIDEILAWLAQKLGVTAALAAVPHTRRLVVIAHDVIANVPFAALPVDGVALCERVAISQLDRLSRLQRRRGPRAIGRFVGLGVTRYGGTMPDLPGAGREVAAITDLIGEPRASPRLDTAATCDAFRAALRSATHVHVAAHGRFDLGDPAASSIVLHDGAITLRDLGSIRPRELRVVALPTCWSAEAATLPGRERICLPTALLDIGARSVVASLWAVGDESSADLMLETYRHMRRLGPAAALTAAQAARARRGEPRRDWAGFLCYGRD
jgi:CHAT domain-containing protein